jgi:putative addiction module component (TIGR02574 family)
MEVDVSSVRIKDLLELSVAERIQLVEDLWDSIAADPEAPGLAAAQRSELDRRLDDQAATPEGGRTWAEVRDRLYKKYG